MVPLHEVHENFVEDVIHAFANVKPFDRTSEKVVSRSVDIRMDNIFTKSTFESISLRSIPMIDISTLAARQRRISSMDMSDDDPELLGQLIEFLCDPAFSEIRQESIHPSRQFQLLKVQLLDNDFLRLVDLDNSIETSGDLILDPAPDDVDTSFVAIGPDFEALSLSHSRISSQEIILLLQPCDEITTDQVAFVRREEDAKANVDSDLIGLGSIWQWLAFFHQVTIEVTVLEIDLDETLSLTTCLIEIFVGREWNVDWFSLGFCRDFDPEIELSCLAGISFR